MRHRLRHLGAPPLLVAAVAVATLLASPEAAFAAPFDCQIGDLSPTELDVGAVASWPGPLDVGVATTLSLEIDLGSGIATIPGLRGQVTEVVVTMTEPGLEFTGGTAQLGRTESLQEVTVEASEDAVTLTLTEPVTISGERPLPRIVAELTAIPIEVGELSIDTGDLTATYMLLADGVDDPYPTECATSDPVPIVIATVGGDEADDGDAPDEGSVDDEGPVGSSGTPSTTVPTEVLGETETLPHTGPPMVVWVCLILGLVVLDLGWALRSAARPDGQRARHSLFPRRW